MKTIPAILIIFFRELGDLARTDPRRIDTQPWTHPHGPVPRLRRRAL